METTLQTFTDKISSLFGNSFSINNSVVNDIKSSDIIEKEYINIHEHNDLIKPNIEKFLKYIQPTISKKLYDYQLDLFAKMLELERVDNTRITQDGTRITTNAYCVGLRVGCGKSLPFLCLAMYGGDVPKHNIIISTSGRNVVTDVPDAGWDQLKIGYQKLLFDDHETHVCEITEYDQRDCTVIITYPHLLRQMQLYMRDFDSSHTRGMNIKYVEDMRQLRSTAGVKIMFVTNTTMNLNILMKSAYIKPFKRLIIDDYSTMNNISEIQLIPASVTWLISGTGFTRDDQIPICPYAIKYANRGAITLLGDNDKIMRGTIKNNLLSGDIKCQRNDFCTYLFKSQVQGDLIEKIKWLQMNYPFLVPRNVNVDIMNVYPPCKDNVYIKDLISLKIMLNNFSKLITTATSILERCQMDAANGETTTKDSVPNFFKYVGMFPQNNIIRNAFVSKLSFPDIRTNTSLVINSKCLCKTPLDVSEEISFISSCCGRVICPQCFTSCLSADNKCMFCHRPDPVYYLNNLKVSTSNASADEYIIKYCDTSMINDNVAPCDYVFYMLLNGLKPKYKSAEIIGEAEVLRLRDTVVMHILLAMINCINTDCAPNSSIICYGMPQDIYTYIYQHVWLPNKAKSKYMYNVNLQYFKSVSDLVGFQSNVIGIINWREPEKKEDRTQLIGRIMRISLSNPFYFYINCKDYN